MEAESDQLRVKRRSAKGKFTRQVRTVEAMVLNERSHSEVYVNWQSLQRLYDELQDRHDAFCETIDPKDEAAYDEEEEWMEKCRETYVKVSMSMNDYIRNVSSNDKGNDADSSVSKSDTTVTADERNAAKPETVGAANKTEVGSNENKEIGSAENSSQKQQAGDSECRPSTFKLEFSQMPKFTGDVREYSVFRSDFKDLIEPKCSKRDAITLLRNNLIGKPHELIKGMGKDYTAAWEFLDAVYGDPRVITDAVTYDITSFAPLKEDEDTRFCELCHLVRRSFNTLKDIGRQADLDNNHMLAIIEQKMSRDDRKIWSRKVEEGQIPATLEQLLHWMTIEMKSRMRASALIREGPQSTCTSRVNYVTNVNNANRVPVNYGLSDRCWICKSTSHWVDECERFKSLTITERMDMIKENHACCCCLKRTGKNHAANTCYRRRQCMVHSGREPCKEYHHPLLHTDRTEGISNMCVVGVAGVASDGTMLPILDGYVLGQRKERKSANLLLDSGAQISLIRTQLAEELKLPGEDITITVNKVGGHEETLKTKRYDVYVQSVDKNHTTCLSAIGIPHITDDISLIRNLNEKARQLKVPLRDIHRGSGPVDILVGINCPLLHTGETLHNGNMIARKSPLGWVIFGTEGRISQPNRVLNVQVEKPAVNPRNGTHVLNTDTTHAVAKQCTREKSYLSHVETHKSKLKDLPCDSGITDKRGQCYVPCNRSRAIQKRKPIENTPNKEYTNVYREVVPPMKDTKRDHAIYAATAVASVATLQTRKENTLYPVGAATANRNVHANETCDRIHEILESKTTLETNHAFTSMKGWSSTTGAKLKPLLTIMNVFLYTAMLIVLMHPHGQGFRPAVSVRVGEYLQIPGGVTRSGDVYRNELHERWIHGPQVLRTEATETKVHETYMNICVGLRTLYQLLQERKHTNGGNLVKSTADDTYTARQNFMNREKLIVDEMYRIEDQGNLNKGIQKHEIKEICHCARNNVIQQLLIEPQKEPRQIIQECDTVSIRKISPDCQMAWRFITPQNGCAASYDTYLLNLEHIWQISNYSDDTSNMYTNNRVPDSPFATVSHAPSNERKNSRHKIELLEHARSGVVRRVLYVQKKWHVERRNVRPNALRSHWEIGSDGKVYKVNDKRHLEKANLRRARRMIRRTTIK